MAQENLSSTNTWDWNCPPGVNDLDYRIVWGNRWGSITIQKENLLKIEIFMNCWNSKDGYVNKTQTITVNNRPTSDPYTFNNFYLGDDFARFIADQYWGVRYTMEGKIKVYYGTPPGEIIDTVTVLVDGCFRGNDAHKDPIYFVECVPPNVNCDEQ